MSTFMILVLALAFVGAPLVVSYVVEALRHGPASPSSIAYADLGGTRVKYLSSQVRTHKR